MAAKLGDRKSSGAKPPVGGSTSSAGTKAANPTGAGNGALIRGDRDVSERKQAETAARINADMLVPADGDEVPSGPPTAPTRVVGGGASAPNGDSAGSGGATKEWTGHDILAGDTLTVAAPAPAPPTSPPTSPPGMPDYGVREAAQPAVARSRVSTTGVKPGDLASRVPQIMEQGLRRGSKVRARKVRRVVRHIDPWSVLTFSVIFHLCVFAALLLASVLVWNAAEAAGTIANIESFIQELGDYTDYEIAGDVVFRAAMIIAGVLTLASSVLVVLLTVVFNLISDLVGGIRMTVVEEETVKVNRNRNQNR